MPYGWAGPQQSQFSSAAPPQYILDALAQSGFVYDPSRYAWNPDTMNIVDVSTGAQYYQGGVPDPSLGTDVTYQGQTYLFGAGENPYFGMGDSAQGYAAGVAPNSGMFISADPNEINDYQSHAQDVVNQGVMQVAAIPALGAWGASTGSGPIFGGSSAAGGAATTYPLASGGPVTVSPLAGAAPAAGAGGGAAAAGGILDSSGAVIPGTEAVAGGGGMWENILGGLRGNWGSLAGGLLGYMDANNQPNSMTSIYAPDAALTEAGRGLLGTLPTGYTAAGLDPATAAAIQRLQGFGGDAINPYLDRVFNTAADATRSRLSSEFARSGRGVGSADHAGYRSDELQTLAADIYGNGYENERNRELASVAPLLAAGDYSRSVTQQQLDAPMTGAMQRMAALNGLLPLFPGTNTQPLFNNPWAGFLGGAQLGRMFQGA
jgi:hypothetical protein